MKHNQTHRNIEPDQSPHTWKRAKKGRILFDTLTILLPVIIILGTFFLLYSFFAKKDTKTDGALRKWKSFVIAQRVFDSPKIPADMFFPILTNAIEWGALQVTLPYYWIYYFDKRYGGNTLSVQPQLNAPYGMHIQMEKMAQLPADLEDAGLAFLRNLRLYPRATGRIRFLDEPGFLFYVTYVNEASVPMDSIFIFIIKEDYLLKIVAYSPQQMYRLRKNWFDAILQTFKWIDQALPEQQDKKP